MVGLSGSVVHGCQVVVPTSWQRHLALAVASGCGGTSSAGCFDGHGYFNTAAQRREDISERRLTVESDSAGRASCSCRGPASSDGYCHALELRHPAARNKTSPRSMATGGVAQLGHAKEVLCRRVDLHAVQRLDARVECAPGASCSQIRSIQLPDAALRRPAWRLPGTMPAGLRPMWLGACACWLPLWLPLKRGNSRRRSASR
jgi:hypothetical protein